MAYVPPPYPITAFTSTGVQFQYGGPLLSTGQVQSTIGPIAPPPINPTTSTLTGIVYNLSSGSWVVGSPAPISTAPAPAPAPVQQATIPQFGEFVAPQPETEQLDSTIAFAGEMTGAFQETLAERADCICDEIRKASTALIETLATRLDRISQEISRQTVSIGQAVSGRVNSFTSSVLQQAERFQEIDYFPLGGSLPIAAAPCRYVYYDWQKDSHRTVNSRVSAEERLGVERLIGVNIDAKELESRINSVKTQSGAGEYWEGIADKEGKKCEEREFGPDTRVKNLLGRTLTQQEYDDVVSELRSERRKRESELADFRKLRESCEAKDLEIDRLKARLKERAEEGEASRRTLIQTALGWFPNWGVEKTCQAIMESVKAAEKSSACSVRELVGTRDIYCNFIRSKWARGIEETLPGWANGIGVFLNSLIDSILTPIDGLIELVGKISGCAVGPAINTLIAKAVLSAAEKWSGVSIPKAHESFDRLIDFACPTNIPSQAETDQLYLMDQIEKGIWECWTRANNTIPNHHEKVVYASRAQLSSLDLLRLWLRDGVTDGELKKRLRGQGWIDEKEVELLIQLAYETPTPSDLVPFVVRDVFDEEAARIYKLDAEYDKKVSKDARRLFRAAGLNEDFVKLHWRAHWKFPSNTQLYKMYHRLRNRKGGTGVFKRVDDNGKALPKPVEIRWEDVAVTETEVAHVLGINDILPFWRDRLLAISRPPMTRVDVRRAFDIDTIGPDEVLEAYKDLGYSEENAERLTKFAIDLKKRGDLRRYAKLTPATITRLYRSHTITRTEASRLLSIALFKPEQIESALEQSEIQASADAKKKCLAAIRKRFLLGDIEGVDLFQILATTGVDSGQARTLSKEWQCELTYKAKEVAAGMLCKWFGSGILTVEEYLTRLERIGYSTKDAERIVTVCKTDREIVRARAGGEKGAETQREKAAGIIAPEIEKVSRSRRKKGRPAADGNNGSK